MPKNIENKPVGTSRVSKIIVRLFVVLILVVAGYGVWKYPNLIEYSKSWFVSKPQIDVYQSQIDELKRQVSNLNNQLQMVEGKTSTALSQVKAPNLAPLYDKIAMIEKINMNVIDSKADVSTVLGVVTRMDKAEHKLDKLSAITDDSALTLTAAMLVKDAAEREVGFEYEAGVLSQIVSDNPALKNTAVQIEKFAKTGLVSELKLIKSFDVIYTSILNVQKEDFNKNWKERLTNKLHEIVKVKKTNADEPTFVADKKLENIKAMVDNGQLSEALSELEGSSGDAWISNPQLQGWMAKVKSREEFLSLINSITAQSLASMKVKFLKGM